MQPSTSPVQTGVLTCDRCKVTLHGYDAFFNVCNGCATRILVEVDQRWTFCKQYPGCGCRVPSECTEESVA